VADDLILLGPVVPALAGVLGLVLGSFLNVCILRWPRDESVVRPPSRCPGCGSGIAWYDNIPVVSWILLRGKCRKCGERISVQYPLVELATGLLWAWMAWRHGVTLEALRGATFGTILLGIAMADGKFYLIPDEFTLGGLAIGLAFSLAGGLPSLGEAVLGAAVGFGLLWLVGILGTLAFKEEAMGGGDIKMMAMVGAFVGWPGVLLTIFLGALLGSVIFVPLALAGRKKHVPFGVFLALGAAAAWVAGPSLLAWYRDTFLLG
jgi:leader peptidase (prepilin peptidase)/N-methyltransferase